MVDKSSFLQRGIHFTLATALQQGNFSSLVVSPFGKQCVGRPDINGLPNFQFEPRFSTSPRSVPSIKFGRRAIVFANFPTCKRVLERQSVGRTRSGFVSPFTFSELLILQSPREF